MAKTRPDSRLYALLHPDMWKWGRMLCLNQL